MNQIPKFTILTFVTENTPYIDVYYKYLFNSAKNLSLPIICEYVKNRHSWLKNVAYKPEIILNCLNKGINNIVFLDSDAEITEYPILFDNNPQKYDIAVHYLNWFQWYGHTPGKKELLSGTMFLRNNDKVKLLVNDWLKYAQKYDRWEQQVLSEVIDKIYPYLKIYELPIEYCYIESLPGGEKPRVKVEHPIIVHHQVSRYLKRIIGR